MRKLETGSHTETVSALEWLPDGTGFLSGAFDRKIILWVSEAGHLRGTSADTSQRTLKAKWIVYG